MVNMFNSVQVWNKMHARIICLCVLWSFTAWARRDGEKKMLTRDECSLKLVALKLFFWGETSQ